MYICLKKFKKLRIIKKYACLRFVFFCNNICYLKEVCTSSLKYRLSLEKAGVSFSKVAGMYSISKINLFTF